MAQRRKRPALVGRDEELRRLLALLRAARRGHGGAALVSGEPGIGKTRLLTELAERAERRGVLVLWGRAYETAGMPPYLPFVEALRDYARAVSPEQLRAALGDSASTLAQLLPELRDPLPDLPAAPPLTADMARYRLFEDTAAALHGIARCAPGGLLLVLDDLHWADESSLLLLKHMAQRLGGARLLLALNYRTVDPAVSTPLQDALAEFVRQGVAADLPLSPLAPEATATLIGRITGGQAAAELCAAVHQASGGNPFYAGELARHLRAEGGQGGDGDADAIRLSVPPTVRLVVARRLDRLSSASRRALDAAAVLGERFEFALLAQSLALLPDRLLAPLDEAIAAGLVRTDGNSYQFAHALVREVVYTALVPARREQLHLAAAEAIEAVHAANLEPQLAALALHYRLAGDAALSKAIDYAVAAGEAAERVFAFDAIVAHWQTAVALLERAGGEANERRMADLLDRLSGRLAGWGDEHNLAAIAIREREVELRGRLGDRHGEAWARVNLGGALGMNAATLDLSASARHFKLAEAMLKETPNVPAFGMLKNLQSITAIWMVRPEEGLRHAEEALAVSACDKLSVIGVLSSSTRGLHQVALGRVASGLEVQAQAYDDADRLNDPFIAFILAQWYGLRLAFLRDPRSARVPFDCEVASGRQRFAPDRQQALSDILASLDVMSGDLASAATRIDRRQAAAFASTPFILPSALLAYWGGVLDRAAQLWQGEMEQHHEKGSLFAESQFALLLAQERTARAEFAEAARLLRRVLAIAVEGRHVLVELQARAELALLLAEADPSVAASHLVRCRAILAQGEDWRGLAGRAALAEAVVKANVGGVAAAQEPFDRAIAIFTRYSLVWDQAEALHRWGHAALVSGTRTAAAEKLHAALDLYRTHDAGEFWLERVRRDLERIAGTEYRTDRKRANSHQVLTPREIEVLRLLAQGLSNREIATELSIAQSTAIRHVEHIFARIGATNRVEAAAYSFRTGIAQANGPSPADGTSGPTS